MSSTAATSPLSAIFARIPTTRHVRIAPTLDGSPEPFEAIITTFTRNAATNISTTGTLTGRGASPEAALEAALEAERASIFRYHAETSKTTRTTTDADTLRVG